MILAVNGERIESARGLIRTVAAVPPGSSVSLTIRRQGREIRCAGHGRAASRRTVRAG